MGKELFKVVASAALGEIVALKFGAKLEAIFKPSTDFQKMAVHAGVVGLSAGVSYWGLSHIIK